jgi:hypothetical protein
MHPPTNRLGLSQLLKKGKKKGSKKSLKNNDWRALCTTKADETNNFRSKMYPECPHHVFAYSDRARLGSNLGRTHPNPNIYLTPRYLRSLKSFTFSVFLFRLPHPDPRVACLDIILVGSRGGACVRGCSFP